MGLQQQDGDKKVEQGPSPSTTATHANHFNNMKTAPILDSYSESSYETAHGDICTNISPTPTYHEMTQFPCEESHHHMSDTSDSTIRDIESISDRGKGVPSFDEMMDIALVEVDFDDPTTNVRGRRALAIAKPTPRGY